MECGGAGIAFRSRGDPERLFAPPLQSTRARTEAPIQPLQCRAPITVVSPGGRRGNRGTTAEFSPAASHRHSAGAGTSTRATLATRRANACWYCSRRRTHRSVSAARASTRGLRSAAKDREPYRPQMLGDDGAFPIFRAGVGAREGPRVCLHARAASASGTCLKNAQFALRFCSGAMPPRHVSPMYGGGPESGEARP